MKRFFILVSMVALVAAGCTKTIIKNEVETPISFSTESGKLTRAIVQDKQYDVKQPFGVYAFAHQTIDNNTTTTDFMVNVEIAHDKTTDPYAWRAAGTTKYYWPNDPRTTIDFYAYSPFILATDQTRISQVAPHQMMTVTGLNQQEDNPATPDIDDTELSFTDYTHSNMYVDFMVATPVKKAKYSDANGVETTDVNDQVEGKVPMTFHHQMTQIVFTVKTDVEYSNINFAVQRITLKNIYDNAAFTHTYSKEQAVQNPTEGGPTTETVYSNYGEWSEWKKTSEGENNPNGVYQIFPADESDFGGEDVNEYDYNFSNNTVKDVNNAANFTGATGKIVTNTSTWTTTPVTMIPQNMEAATTPPVAGQDSYARETAGQMFEIVYSIKGTGVASEVVTKHVPFRAANATALNWGVNQKITYNIEIGLKEITFEPSVETWVDGTGDEFTFAQ